MLARQISIQGISLAVVYWFYSFVFFGVAPLIQAWSGVWRHEFNHTNLGQVSVILLVSHISFLLAYFGRFRHNADRYQRSVRPSHGQSVIPVALDQNLLILVASVLFLVAVVASFVFGPHFTSSIVRTIFGNSYSPVESIAEFTTRPFLFFLFAFSLCSFLRGARRPAASVSVFLLAISVFLIIGPFSGARSIIFFLYFSALLVVLNAFIPKYPLAFGSLLFVGVFASEMQNLLRDFLFSGSTIQVSGINYFFQGHFDGFEMMGHCVTYVSEFGVTYGRQLLGAFFFWMPRSLWAEKPIGSGDFVAYESIAKSYPVEFANFSMPLMAEAFLNFGIVGVTLFFLVLGRVCGKLDRRFSTYCRARRGVSLVEPLWLWRYCTLLGLSLFIYRGDLMSGMSFVTGLMIAVHAAWYLVHRKRVVPEAIGSYR